MTATVDIIIKATDKASKTINDTNKGLKNMKSGLNDVVRELTGFNLGTIGAVGGVVALGNMAKQSITNFSAYAESVDKMSMSTGMAVEEASRLVQISDDVRIGQESVEQAMKMGLQNGFVPTIESIAKLSDEYRQYKDPAERAAAMQDVFGKSWEDLVPLLEQGGDSIRTRAAEIEDGMIVTKEAAEANRQYQKSLDDLADAWTGVQNAFAKDAIADLSIGLTVFAQNIEDLRSGVPLLKVLADNQAEYALQEKIAASRAYNWSDAEREAMRATQAATVSVRAASESSREGAESLRDLGDGAEFAALAQQRLGVEAGQNVTLLGQLRGAQEDLAAAEQAWAEGAGGQATGMLNESALGAQKYLDALGAADEVFGTHTKLAEEQERAMEDANKQYQATGDLQAYKTKLGEIKDTYAPLDETVISSTKKVETFAEQWNALESKNLTLRVTLGDIPDTGGGGPYKRKVSGESDGATGLDMDVPPGYPGDRYKIGVTSGEHVTVTPAGQNPGGTGGGITIGSIILPGVKNAQQLLTELGKLSARAQKSGQQYAGSY
jgi:hypothetical protein